MIGAAATVALVGINAGGVSKFGWPLKTALAYYVVIMLSFAVGALGHSTSTRTVASREANEGPSKENQMSGLVLLQLFGAMGALFFLGGRLFDDF
ncbi:hypothetical protein [Streptomyces sp. NPDC095613]|uniref:hypothetical protein n=1 Tax=Streptomyces sp. NPDC095613 TaxID=3155540 RepID=UPI00333112E0